MRVTLFLAKISIRAPCRIDLCVGKQSVSLADSGSNQSNFEAVFN